MGTEIAAQKTQGIIDYASTLSPPNLDKHRAFIAVRMEALLSPYWDKQPSDVVMAEIAMDWMDALQLFTPDEIRMACREYLNGPDRRIKPKPGDIRSIILTDRARRVAARRVQKPREDYVNRFDPDEVARRKQVAAEVMSKFRRVVE